MVLYIISVENQPALVGKSKNKLLSMAQKRFKLSKNEVEFLSECTGTNYAFGKDLESVSMIKIETSKWIR